MFAKSSRNRKSIIVAVNLFLVLILAFSLVTSVSAHQTVTVGDYSVEYGWLNEPAVSGQPNAVVINLTLTSATQPADVDVSALKIEALFGGQTKVLTLQPLAENTPGQFIAPITPMRPGKYTIHLSGNIGATAFNNDLVPEEVQTADVVQFPVLAASAPAPAPFGLAGWLAILGIVIGAVAALIAAISLFRKPLKS